MRSACLSQHPYYKNGSRNKHGCDSNFTQGPPGIGGNLHKPNCYESRAAPLHDRSTPDHYKPARELKRIANPRKPKQAQSQQSQCRVKPANKAFEANQILDWSPGFCLDNGKDMEPHNTLAP
jgi:hypothetical protein